jgi:hypothetical protein
MMQMNAGLCILASFAVFGSSVSSCIARQTDPAAASQPNAGAKGEVRITRNYSAEYNATIEKIPEAERAWPVYREAQR